MAHDHQSKRSEGSDGVKRSRHPKEYTSGEGKTASNRKGRSKPGPWSVWVPADDGQWFYRGRLLLDGTWEYEFLDGSWVDASQQMAFPVITSGHEPVGSQIADIQGTESPRYVEASRRTATEEEPQANKQELSLVRIDNRIEPYSASGKTKKLAAAQTKKLKTIIMRDKQKQLNSKNKVKTWLSGIDDPDPE